MELTTEEVLEINRALQVLSESKDNEELREADTIKEAAKVIILYAHSLKRGGRINIESSLRYTKGSNLKGNTEYGNVEIEEKKDNSVKKSYGLDKERIGHYRLWQSHEGRIWFHHFWKSDLITEEMGRPVTKFCISYDHKNLNVTHFGYAVKKHWLKLGPLTIGKNILEPIYGTGRYVTGYFFEVRIHLHL